jgi:hypothetical protein
MPSVRLGVFKLEDFTIRTAEVVKRKTKYRKRTCGRSVEVRLQMTKATRKAWYNNQYQGHITFSSHTVKSHIKADIRETGGLWKFYKETSVPSYEGESSSGRYGDVFYVMFFVPAPDKKVSKMPTLDEALAQITSQETADLDKMLLTQVIEYAKAAYAGWEEARALEKRTNLANSVLEQVVDEVVTEAKVRCRFKERLAGLKAEFEAHKQTIACEQIKELEDEGILFKSGEKADDRVTQAVIATVKEAVKGRGIPGRPFIESTRDRLIKDEHVK